MSKQSKQVGTETGDDVSSLFAKLGSSGAYAYRDFSAELLHPAEPPAMPVAQQVTAVAAASPPPPAALSVASAPATAVAPTRATPPSAPPALAEPPAFAADAPPPRAATPLQQLFRRLLESGCERPSAPGGPLQRLLHR